MTQFASIEAPASMDHWDEFVDFIEHQAGLHLGQGKRNYGLRLACEEIISNIVRETQDEQSLGQFVTLSISTLLGVVNQEHWLQVLILDNGPHYDPHFERERGVDVNQPLEERRPGGLGLFLVQKSVDKVEYLWVNSMNRYTLWMRLDEPASGSE
jgi:anti-sigma regulatory factor (Ser/Thr protein kinase)